MQTFAIEELVATKIRALYQRRKGRDLFDLWLALEHLLIDPDRIVDAFSTYRPDGYTADRAIELLTAHAANRAFRADIAALAVVLPFEYDIDVAAAVVCDGLLRRVD